MLDPFKFFNPNSTIIQQIQKDLDSCIKTAET